MTSNIFQLPSQVIFTFWNMIHVTNLRLCLTLYLLFRRLPGNPDIVHVPFTLMNYQISKWKSSSLGDFHAQPSRGELHPWINTDCYLVRLQCAVCVTFSTSCPCKCSPRPVSNLGNRPNPSMKTIRNVWFGETNWFLPPPNCSLTRSPATSCWRHVFEGAGWPWSETIQIFWGERCMKHLDSSCWVVTAAGVAAAVVFVFVVYQSHKHLGLLDPSFESPRLWNTGSTWAPNSLSKLSWSWNSWYRRSKVGAFMNHYIAHWKLWWKKNLPNVKWMWKPCLYTVHILCIHVILIHLSIPIRLSYGQVNFLTTQLLFCILHLPCLSISYWPWPTKATVLTCFNTLGMKNHTFHSFKGLVANGHAIFLLLLAKWECELMVSSLRRTSQPFWRVLLSSGLFTSSMTLWRKAASWLKNDGLEILRHTGIYSCK